MCVSDRTTSPHILEAQTDEHRASNLAVSGSNPDGDATVFYSLFFEAGRALHICGCKRLRTSVPEWVDNRALLRSALKFC